MFPNNNTPKPPPNWLPLAVILAIALIGWLIYAGADPSGQAKAEFVDVLTLGGTLALLLGLYMLPYLLGRRRGIANRGALWLVNLLTGWTIIGWFGCLIWAACGATAAQDAFFRRPIV